MSMLNFENWVEVAMPELIKGYRSYLQEVSYDYNFDIREVEDWKTWLRAEFEGVRTI